MRIHKKKIWFPLKKEVTLRMQVQVIVMLPLRTIHTSVYLLMTDKTCAKY